MQGGAILKKQDRADFSHSKVFGKISLEEIPLIDFMTAEPLEIKNQYSSDFCVGFATASVLEDHEGVILSAEWIFSQIKKMRGNWEEWGARIKDGAEVAVKIGAIEKADAPYSLEDKSRDFLANPESWPDLADKAAKHRQKSYFRPDGQIDTFESFRAVLWQNRAIKSSILTGVFWRDAWRQAKEGIITEEESAKTTPHALKICGQKIINGEPYLVGQLSGCKDEGNNGLFYFPKMVINRDFIYEALLFRDILPDEAKKKCWGFWRTIWQKVVKFIKEYFKILLE